MATEAGARSFVVRGAAGLAAAAAVVLVAGALIVGTGGAAPGASGPSPAPQAATGTSHPSPAAPSATEITRAEAIAAVEAFIGRKLGQTDVGDPTAVATGTWIEVIEVEPNGVSAWVDASTGRVTSLLMPAPETTNMALSPDGAQAAAASFLTAHSIPFEGLTPAVTVEDHGCCKFYVVTWQRYVNGASVLDTRIVKLDPSNGAVFSFMDTRVPYGSVPSPRIGREEAIRIATVANGEADPLLGEVKLLADGRPFWPGRLVWSVQFGRRAGASGGGAIVYVDAITGEAKVVARAV